MFKHKGPNPNLAKTIKMQASEFFLCINRPKCNNYRIIKQVRWEKPRSRWLKLNTDGSYDDSLGNAGGGGVIIDEYGNWVVGFTRKVERASSFITKAWALRDDLLLCIQMNLSDVIVKLDAKALVDALNNPAYANSVISPLFDDCRQLATQIPRIIFRHIYCEANLWTCYLLLRLIARGCTLIEFILILYSFVSFKYDFLFTQKKTVFFFFGNLCLLRCVVLVHAPTWWNFLPMWLPLIGWSW